MGMTLQDAAQEAAKFGQMIRALGKLQETADALLGIEQNITERTELRDKLADENALLAQDKAQLLAEVEATRAQAASLIQDAKDEAARIVDAANTKASLHLAAAKQTEADANAYRNEVNAQVDAAREVLNGLEAAIAEGRATIAAAQALDEAMKGLRK